MTRNKINEIRKFDRHLEDLRDNLFSQALLFNNVYLSRKPATINRLYSVFLINPVPVYVQIKENLIPWRQNF